MNVIPCSHLKYMMTILLTPRNVKEDMSPFLQQIDEKTSSKWQP